MARADVLDKVCDKLGYRLAAAETIDIVASASPASKLVGMVAIEASPAWSPSKRRWWCWHPGHRRRHRRQLRHRRRCHRMAATSAASSHWHQRRIGIGRSSPLDIGEYCSAG
jgi:hypothetical protein